jgi:hypothetical protein
MPTQTVSRKVQAAQVYFPMHIYLQIKQIAADEGKPMAAWVRDTVTKEIEEKTPKKKTWAEIPTFSWPETDHKLSEHIDDILYGNP